MKDWKPSCHNRLWPTITGAFFSDSECELIDEMAGTGNVTRAEASDLVAKVRRTAGWLE